MTTCSTGSGVPSSPASPAPGLSLVASTEPALQAVSAMARRASRCIDDRRCQIRAGRGAAPPAHLRAPTGYRASRDQVPTEGDPAGGGRLVDQVDVLGR